MLCLRRDHLPPSLLSEKERDRERERRENEKKKENKREVTRKKIRGRKRDRGREKSIRESFLIVSERGKVSLQFRGR